MSQIACYVVNLASATARRATMEDTLRRHGVDAEFFPAVDGRLMSEEDLESHVDRAKAELEYGALSRAEIGTSLSHVFIYRDIVQRNIDCAVILEDDVCLAADFRSLIQTNSVGGLASAFSAAEPVMVQLSYVPKAYRGTAQRMQGHGRHIVRPYGGVWLTSGYFITLAAARNLASGLYPVWTVADHWNRFEEKGLVTLRALSPNVVWESEHAQQSSISAGRQRRRRSVKTLRSRLRRIGVESFVKPLLVRRLPRIS